MYLLDTNIVSELRKAKGGKADKNVTAWAQSVSATSMFLSAITILELATGILLIERREPTQGAILRAWLDGHVLPAFDGRILAVDIAVAQRCAKLNVLDPRPHRDALIAATAQVHGMTVVTRNVADFESIGTEIFNPWLSSDTVEILVGSFNIHEGSYVENIHLLSYSLEEFSKRYLVGMQMFFDVKPLSKRRSMLDIFADTEGRFRCEEVSYTGSMFSKPARYGQAPS